MVIEAKVHHAIINSRRLTLSNIVDAVHVGLVVLIVKELTSPVYDFEWLDLGVVQTQ